MVHTFAVYVENKPGVLNRVASLFRRRAFNIESLTVGHTETPGLSRMTVVVDTDEYGARRLAAPAPACADALRAAAPRTHQCRRRPSCAKAPASRCGRPSATRC